MLKNMEMSMGAENFQTFHSFSDPEVAEQFADLLKANNIPFDLVKAPVLLDSAIIGTSSLPDILIKLRPDDFERGHQCLEDYFKKITNEVEKDYYLFSFTDSELLEIVHKPDEWGYFDYQLAQKILKDRGIDLNESALQQFKVERKENLARPERAGSYLFVVAILFILSGLAYAISPLLGLTNVPFVWCIMGVFIGLMITTSKKTLPDGQRVYTYAETDRKYGALVWQIGLLVFLATMLRYMLQSWTLNQS